jgi:hypothetical protein
MSTPAMMRGDDGAADDFAAVAFGYGTDGLGTGAEINHVTGRFRSREGDLTPMCKGKTLRGYLGVKPGRRP